MRMRTVGEVVTRSRGELHGGPANEESKRGGEGYSQGLSKIEHEENAYIYTTWRELGK